jgi:tetratricopeptide (TPR) repeat protein
MSRIGIAATAVACWTMLCAPAAIASAAGDAEIVGTADPQGSAWRVAVRAGLEHDLHGRHDAADAVWDALERLDWADAEPWIRRVDTVYWRHFYDEAQPLDAERIRTLLDHAQALASERLDHDPDDLRARWLLGEALMQEARFEGMRGNYMHAGTVGERGRKHLEAVLDRDPEHPDAPYMLGLYYYFSSLAPEFLRYVNWLWFVPKGDREQGLSLLEKVRRGDGLYAANASMVLFTIHAYHTPTNVPAATALAQQLHAQYPENAIIHFELLEVLLMARQPEALETAALALEARRGESPGTSGRAAMAPLWRARSALRAGHDAEGRRLAFAVDPEDPDLPGWGVPWVWVVRGQALDRGGERDAALAAYARAVELADPGFHGQRPRRLATAGLERPFDPGSDLDGSIVGGD